MNGASDTNLRLTVREAAALMNVSERSVYMARTIHRSGRADLIEAIQAGTMSLHRATQLLKGETANLQSKPNGTDRLIRAWNGATEAERFAFIEAITDKTIR